MLTQAVKRMAKHLRKQGLLEEEDDEEPNELAALTASAVSGASPPAGPEFRRGALPLSRAPMKFGKSLCAALDGFTLHAATRAGARDPQGREALLKYILRPAVAQARVTQGPGGLVRIALKRPFSEAPLPSTWIRCPFSAAWRHRYLLGACTPFGMQVFSAQPARFGRVFCPSPQGTRPTLSRSTPTTNPDAKASAIGRGLSS